MKISTVDVTPELAEAWLSHNTHNRNVRTGTVNQWADDMRNGEWLNDTDPIRFHGYFDDPPTVAAECAEHGCNTAHPVLLNGQHRLHAIIAARVTLPLLVVEGLAMADQAEMDTGSKRALADQLRLNGHGSPTVLAGILRLSYLYDRDELRALRRTPSYAALLHWLDKHPEIIDALPPARKLYHAIGGRSSVYGTAWFALGLLDTPGVEEDREAWWDMLTYGENLKGGDPALVLRNAILSLSRSPTRRRLSQVQSLAVFFKAWNTWRDGSLMSTLTWRATGSHPEAFPEPY